MSNIDLPLSVVELQAGDIVRDVQNNLPFNTKLVLKHDRENRVVKFARPMVHGCLYGTTAPSANLSAEIYSLYYVKEDKDKKEYILLDKDMNYSGNHRQLIYKLLPLDKIRAAWDLIHNLKGVSPIPNPPENEFEFRQKAWELEYSTFFGTDRMFQMWKHLPLELEMMD